MSEQSDTPRTDAATGQIMRVPMKFINKIARERDEARAEVERLRSAFVHCHVRGSSGDLCAVCGLDLRDKVHTAATEAARKFCGVGELERTGYIPAGSADEREAKP